MNHVISRLARWVWRVLGQFDKLFGIEAWRARGLPSAFKRQEQRVLN